MRDLFIRHGAQFGYLEVLGGFLRSIERFGQFAGDTLAHGLNLLSSQNALADQALRIQHGYRRMLLDSAIKDRLRVAGVVAFVMPVTPVADHVDDDVLLKLLPVVESNLRDADSSFGIVAIDMENRRLHAASYVGRVRRRAGLVRKRREPDLVIDDQVDGAACPVPIELRQV